MKINDHLKQISKYNVIKKRAILFSKTDLIGFTTLDILRKFSEIELDLLKPVKISGDGNCLYRSISKAMYGSENFHSEIRYRTGIELFLNIENFLDQNVANLTLIDNISSKSRSSKSSREILFEEIKESFVLSSTH